MKPIIQELLDLIKANPDLPIIVKVDSEVVGDDSYSWWLGQWGSAEIVEYYKGREYYHEKTDDEEDVLNDLVGCKYSHDYDGRDIYDLSDDDWNKLYASVPWIKAIAVHIVL